jgi:hypothetical protein
MELCFFWRVEEGSFHHLNRELYPIPGYIHSALADWMVRVSFLGIRFNILDGFLHILGR